MYTQTIKMPVQKDSNIVKIAVELTDQVPQLIEFNQKQPLIGIIQELCNGWDIPDFESFSLQFSDNNNQNYITEKNRNEVKNGSILRLEYSPSKTSSDILANLNNKNSEEKVNRALEKLSKISKDITFALEFINKHGLSLIISQIEIEKYKGSTLAYCLQSFVELMDHGIVFWDILEAPFINKVASYINNQAIAIDSNVIKSSLSILENIVLNSTGKCSQVEKEITFPNLVMHLQNMNSQIQQNAIALINALFLKADIGKRRAVAATLQSKQVRNVFLTNVIQSTGQVGTEMAHQLYVLQTLMLSLLEQRMITKMDNQDQDAHDKIKELRRIAFDTEGINSSDITARKQGLFAKDYKKLGFKCDINPALDFTETPPGMLALDCMVYFARNHIESYTKVVLENSCRADEHECPFGRTSVELVKLLCEVLRIGETPSEQGQSYHPMFFTHDHPFEEFYCACIVLLNKTWKEMRATTEDFVKVFSVVREQITRALQSKPTGLDKFKNKLQQLTYSHITNLWQQERTSREEWESHARPIVELKEQITPDIIILIQQQRLGFLIEGSRFTKYSTRGQRIKDKFWYIRLSLNHKVFHYGDCDEKSVPSIDELPTKLAVVEIRGLLTGRDCPHMKDLQRRKTTHILAFSLILDSVDITSLDFVAPDEQVFDYWTDGINALLGNRMNSKEADKDLETLLSMDIKLRLLDAEGIDIPQNPPPIPDLPLNYDFCYDV
ncbi:PREDICTED: engulfment and cell motility protein 1 [Ceratosolen solmsi marchali]|uniref:Engulfment and cell motility protein 1 n=1 Tax=Ceratosolen solmsi marchali TaxID=326594 RepID=A0AAJ6YQD1_9HYME|nr:PREDICTED: engulfment and cell motility protein 1 [Ceratosolen solmsi marchali]